MKEPDYRGLIALVLAVAIGASIFAGVAGAAWSGRSLAEQGGDVLIALGGAIVGALAGYLGNKVLNGKPPP